MQINRKVIFAIALGALIAGTAVFLYMNKSISSQLNQQQMQISQQAAAIDSFSKHGHADLMSHVLNKIDAELKDNPKRILSDETIERIAVMCYAFKPYLRPKSDSVSMRLLSPERGQLLLVLSRMNIDSGSLHKIMLKASFSGADLRDADLGGADLRRANLHGADLQDANLSKANLNKANLSFAYLWGANLREANLNQADLKRANLSWAALNGTELKKADLKEASLASAQLRKADLSGAILKWADLRGAFLNEANLDSADMFRANLIRTQFISSILTDANLTLTNMTEANLTDANLTGLNLTDAVVLDENWLSQLNEWKVTGSQELQSQYKLVSENFKGQTIYRLKKK